MAAAKKKATTVQILISEEVHSFYCYTILSDVDSTFCKSKQTNAYQPRHDGPLNAATKQIHTNLGMMGRYVAPKQYFECGRTGELGIRRQGIPPVANGAPTCP
jgi:hypothetical protein